MAYGHVAQLAEAWDLWARAAGAQISSILIAPQKSQKCGFESHRGYQIYRVVGLTSVQF